MEGLDRVYFDVEIKESINPYLEILEKLTGIPVSTSRENLCSPGRRIFHLCLSRPNGFWAIIITYPDGIEKFRKEKNHWQKN